MSGPPRPGLNVAVRVARERGARRQKTSPLSADRDSSVTSATLGGERVQTKV